MHNVTFLFGEIVFGEVVFVVLVDQVMSCFLCSFVIRAFLNSYDSRRVAIYVPLQSSYQC